jgi:hypothetical protein
MALFLCVCAAAVSLGSDLVSDGIRADLLRERRRLSSDSRTLADTTRRLEAASSELAAAARAVSEAASRNDVAVEDLARREDLLSTAEQEVRSLLERRRILAERVIERRRSITLLEADLQAKKPDGLSGRWAVQLDPGELRGVFRIRLDGTIVAGDYTLESGDSGSLRGTLVNGRLRIERVDSKKGFSAVYYGSLARDGQSIAGTWEAQTFATNEPGSGRWRAVRDESGGED